ncbi:helix-turn-helix transcriptional regulator (plasmid) [Roseivivax marinus]|uniref:helix-turn-helix domain-containing protein n=1 Tax=Roseivivax marinus TaxID=1379903 RepID=UPI001F03F751|nr:helix-turn-helix transcriptional regulator [Roseivivax marinus]UMA67293.1 helix-turn-helix transcriptional regulator [Roseivivax marinus]
MHITSAQCAAARAGLGIKRDNLASLAGVSPRTITDFERGAREPIGSTKAALARALEEAGAVFQDDGGVMLTAEGLDRHRGAQASE